MNMRPVGFLLLILLITCILYLPSAESKDVEEEILENPAGVDELIVQITQYGTISTLGNPTKISINLSIPQENERQDVNLDVNKVTDNLGTEIGVVEETNPGNTYSYSFSGTVTSRANHLTSLPSSYVIPDEAEIFLQSTENIQSSDPDFRELALEITEGSNDDFEKVAKLAMWVHDHLDYDLSYSNENKDALTVLNEKRGVCAEYTTLFIALARSIGIPSKFISGYAYGQLGWERHAFSEVYLGEWIPVDPLWLEIGYMDATHLKFGEHVDNKAKNNVEVSGFSIKNIQWVEDDITLTSVSYSQVQKESDYELTISGDEFRKGDEGVVALSIVPQEFIVGRMVLETCSGEYDVVEVEDKIKKVILRPGEKELLYWNIRINPSLPKNYIFTCPLTLNSRSLALKNIKASVNTAQDERTGRELSAHLSSEVLELGEEQTVYVNVNLYENSRIGIITENNHETYQGGPGDFATSFTFTPEKTGKNSVIVYTSEGETLSLQYEVMSDISIAIEDLIVPKYLKIGEKKNVSARVVNRGSSEQNIRLNINIDGNDNLANFLLKNAYSVSLPVSFQSPGSKTIRFEITGSETDLYETRLIEVYEEPLVIYSTEYADGKGMLKLDVTKSRIKDVTIKVGEKEKKVSEIFGEKDIEFVIAPGEYVMTITCSDIAGKPYDISETIEFREKNFFELILDAINGFVETIMGLFGS